MKKKLMVSLALLLSLGMGLVSCQESNSTPTETSDLTSSQDSNDNSSVGQSSAKEGLYTKLNRALEHLNSTFTASGTLSYYVYNGSSGQEFIYNCLSEVGGDSYYYEERDTTTGDLITVANAFSNSAGKYCERALNPLTNEVEELTSSGLYFQVMKNPISSLEVRKLKGIRDQPNWYVIQDTTVAAKFASYITGYQIASSYLEAGLSLSEFCIHFDGDDFDQFRILVEYEEEYDESSYYLEQYLFELDVLDIGETTPRTLEPFESTQDHENLKKAFEPFKTAKNYTVHVAIDYETSSIEDESYDYFVDVENSMLYSSEVHTGARRAENDEFEYYNYLLGYKEKDGKTYYYYFDTENNHAVISYGDYNEYMGTTDRDMEFLMPKVGLIAPECYKSLGNNTFGTYALTELYCEMALLPYDEYFSLMGDTFKVSLGANNTLSVILTGTHMYASSDVTYETTKQTTTITYVGIDSTVIPDYLINAN